MVHNTMLSNDVCRYDFQNKVALVTGAGRGIGEATSRAFAEANARVVLVDIKKKAVERLAEELDGKYGKGNFLAIEADVTSDSDITRMVKITVETFGRIDVLFNNAGISAKCPLESMNFEDWREVLKVNLDGVFMVSQKVGQVMIKQNDGVIVNMASMSGNVVNKERYNGAYCVSKAGVIMLSKVLAAEWAKNNVSVNALAPGYTMTPLFLKRYNTPELRKELEDLTPLGRLARPAEIARAVMFLASRDCTYLTGHVLTVDGGYTIW